MNQNPIWIHSGWINSTLLIWGETKPKNGQSNNGFIYPFLVPPFDLKLRLFRYDRLSFYGTFISTNRALLHVPLKNREFQSQAGQTIVYQADDSWQTYMFPVEGIEQSINQFVQSIDLYESWSNQEDLYLSDDFSDWIAFLKHVYELLSQGAIKPSVDGKWQLQVKEAWFEYWLKRLPESTFSLTSNQSDQAINDEDKQIAGLALLKNIVDAVVRDLVQYDETQEAFQQWQSSVATNAKDFVASFGQQDSKNAASNTLINTTAFHKQIGLQQEDPFQTALVLNEPKNADANWQISIALADQKQDNLLITTEQLFAGKHPWLLNPVPRLKNDIQLLANEFAMLENLRLSSPSIEVSSDDAYQLFINEHQRLKEIGIKLIVPTGLKKPQALRVLLENKGEQLEENTEPILNWQSLANFQYSVAIGNQTVDESEFKQFVQEKQPFIYINGEWIAWDPMLATELKQYLERVNQQYSYLEAWKLEETESFPEQLDEVEFDIQWSDTLKDKLTELYKNEPQPTPLPTQFNGSLRPYQKKGFDWLIHLRKVGFGGCLADDMGLGKSIQTIAYILYVLENQPVKKAPFLLICPTSLLYNWQLECEKFAPHLKLFIHHGSDRLQEDEPRLYEADLVITSYTLALKDAALFNHVHWNGLILDEAQHIKNKETKQRRAIRKIHAVHRLALTGTPIENRLTELWSLMDLLNPSLLGGYQSFLNTYIRPIEREKSDQKQEHLRSLIKPFLLRRTKKDSETDLQLPNKTEHTVYVDLSLEQAALYQAVVDDISDRIHTVSSLERRAMILRAITRLKQICNHPAQFHKDQTISAHQSGKWDQFVTLTDGIKSKNESALIFTQYKEMGKMISAYLEEHFHQSVPFLHGGLSRKQRQYAVEQFQSDPNISFFVLSLKAGGVGLNLTKATNVIHYDRWWNPAVENQATDRAYRIGQTKEVEVYKLLTTGTVEERIDRLIMGKQALADGVLASSASLTELSDEELLSLIRLNIQ